MTQPARAKVIAPSLLIIAAAWAGSPPAPGYCWYYTDPGKTQGFWDVCR